MQERSSLLRTNADAVLIKELQMCTYHFTETICSGVRYRSIDELRCCSHTSILGKHKL